MMEAPPAVQSTVPSKLRGAHASLKELHRLCHCLQTYLADGGASGGETAQRADSDDGN